MFSYKEEIQNYFKELVDSVSYEELIRNEWVRNAIGSFEFLEEGEA